MDIPLAIHVNKGVVETMPPRANHLVLQARSLRNTLGVLKRRITEMKTKEIHTFEDVEHYKYVLDHLEQRWRDEEGTFLGDLAKVDAVLADACSTLWKECYDLVAKMEEDALEMPSEMRAVHSRLADLHRRLQELGEREHTSAEVHNVVRDLDEIDRARTEQGGIFFGDIEAPPPGHVVCSELLAHNYDLAREVAASAHDEPAELRSVADTLRGVRNDLRKLTGQKHHSTADIAHYRFILMAVASAEAEYGKEWQGSQAEPLLRESLAMVDELERTAEPMGQEMQRTYDQLQKVKQELSAAASTSGRPSESDLQKWLAEVNGLDNERASGGGVFGGGGEGGLAAPPGQAVCKHLLDDCFGLLQELLER